MEIVQLVINGIALGAAYALVALGFVLVLNATSAVNFAQGDMVMAGGFVAVALAERLPWPGILLLPLVLGLMALLGLVFSLLAYFPLKDRPPVSVFISTIAVGGVSSCWRRKARGKRPRARMRRRPKPASSKPWPLPASTRPKPGNFARRRASAGSGSARE